MIPQGFTLPDPTPQALTLQVLTLLERAEFAATEVRTRYGDQIAAYREDISAAVRQAIERLQVHTAAVSGSNPFCAELMRRTGEYLDWLQWVLWDLPYFAVAVQPDRERFRKDLAGCSLIYFACRVLDDFLDRHFLYRGRRETLLAAIAEDHAGQAEGLTVTIATLIYFEGMAQLEGPLRQTIDTMRRVLTGVLMESSPPECWTEEYYEQLIRLKNVDYWRILCAALDPEEQSPLIPFLNDYYAFAQKLNDLQDHGRDETQSRPNYVTMCRMSRRDAKELLTRELLALGLRADGLEEPGRSVALAKWAESCQEAERLGAFRATRPDPVAAAEKLGCTWQTTAEGFLARLGSGVLEDIACPVCGGAASLPLFRKQGFRYVRCPACAHVFVSPRLREVYRDRLRKELRETPLPPPMGEELHADYLCRLLREHSPGPRMLDVRFQPGVLPRVARAYGFQVYGVGDQELLRPLFGERVAEADLQRDEVPWGGFDVIVLSHALDFLYEPRLALPRLREALNRNGLLFVAVSDMASVQFRMFGKDWDDLNPAARPQFFCEESLRRLLNESGFEFRRIALPQLSPELQTRWMRLLRRLNGDEAGDLAVIARPISSPDEEILG